MKGEYSSTVFLNIFFRGGGTRERPGFQLVEYDGDTGGFEENEFPIDFREKGGSIA